MRRTDPTSTNNARPVVSLAAEVPRVGSFRFWFATRRWEWAEEVYRMHGYAPGEVVPTTELLLAHKHPDDRDEVAKTIARAIELGESFSSRHRFVDTGGGVHQVLVVADRIYDDSGTVTGTTGFYIDLTDTLAETERVTLSAMLPDVIEHRAVIEQAKGVLMYIYRISSTQAFKVLAWRSQETNTKLRDLAAQLVDDLAEAPALQPDAVTAFDHLLLTAHTRIPGTGWR
ncbi:PAS and ANTAR domain-containing protein [Nocardia spumae]|uniref:PAS and ANTAR domain-containing protein n=1 Tax=Nocardia spumae TaxID=2887190 RepID=UPI001D15C50D|nr:PAS and ANTAR domain-containing protein [Nocardia spumae]